MAAEETVTEVVPADAPTEVEVAPMADDERGKATHGVPVFSSTIGGIE